MKQLLAAVALVVGLNGASACEPGQVQAVDPKSILFSLSTITDQAPAVAPITRLGRDDIVFHEDEWRQIEFYKANRRPEIERALTELKAAEVKNRVGSGYKDLYLRTVPTSVMIDGQRALATLEATMGSAARSAPVLVHGQSAIVGQVRGGFSFPLNGLIVYGVQDYTGVHVIGAVIQSKAGERSLTQAFGKLHKAHGLIAVDWVGKTLLHSVGPDGAIGVWRP